MERPTGSPTALFEVVSELERALGYRVWSMLHIGGPSHICGPTFWNVLFDRVNIGRGEEIGLLLHSGGGHPEIAYKVMSLFRRRYKKVNVIVPLMAKSAATLMCLGADKILMGEMADLGPIDIQIDDNYRHGMSGFSPLDEFKSMEFLRESAIDGMEYYAKLMNRLHGLPIEEGLEDSVPLITELMCPIFAQIDPIKMGGYRRAIAIGEEYANRMLALVGNSKAGDIVQTMVWDYPAHDFAIEFEEVKALGLPVEMLPESLDQRLVAGILGMGKDSFHGFVSKSNHADSPAPVRKGRKVAPSRHRVNGSEGSRPEQRQ
jgi:hypothetical protein